MVEVGQVWIDKDSRMIGRHVTVVEVGKTHVHYRDCNPISGWVSPYRSYRSRLDRFPKAFKPTDVRLK